MSLLLRLLPQRTRVTKRLVPALASRQHNLLNWQQERWWTDEPVRKPKQNQQGGRGDGRSHTGGGRFDRRGGGNMDRGGRGRGRESGGRGRFDSSGRGGHTGRGRFDSGRGGNIDRGGRGRESGGRGRFDSSGRFGGRGGGRSHTGGGRFDSGRGGRFDSGRGGNRDRGGPGPGQGHGRESGGRPPMENDYDSDGESKKVVETSKSITIARKGAASYCYGCGASLVKKGDQEQQTQSSIGGVSMGIKEQKSGYWHDRSQTLKISKIKNWALCPRCKALQRNSASPDDAQLRDLSPSNEMTQVFRDQVSKIRSQPNAVVVLCVDAVNVHGSLISTLRKYVGGNPVLLAVTRCDLLPSYVSENWSSQKEEQLKRFFAQQAAALKPAGVYLCSVADNDQDHDDDDYYSDDEEQEGSIFGGTKKLARDLWNGLGGRDPYVVGAANIGKSTLTDELIDSFIDMGEVNVREPWERRGHLSDKEKKKRRFAKKTERQHDARRIEKIQEARVTKSSLPGTTLQNIRVPCFPDHMQALWDTPGLLLDPSLSHFPIRNFRRLKAMRPTQIKPQWHDVNQKSFALVVYEKDVDSDEVPLPLLRIEVRLKREKEEGADDPGPVRLVWNSTLDILATDVVEIDQAQESQKRRMLVVEEGEIKQREEEEAISSKYEGMTKEERKAEKEKRVKLEQMELGIQEWKIREEARREARDQEQRLRTLSQLKKVGQEELKPGKVIDVDVAHFGSLGILPPRAALVRVFAPSLGVNVSRRPGMVVPPQWEGDIEVHTEREEDGDSDDEYEGDEDDWFDDDGFDDDDQFGEGYEYGFDEDFFPSEEVPHWRMSTEGTEAKHQSWMDMSGEAVGWIFDDKPRMVEGKLQYQDKWNPVELVKPDLSKES